MSNIEICAALTLRHSKSAFNRANPIQRVTQGFEIYRYHSYGSTIMGPLSEEEYEALRQGEQLIETSMTPDLVDWGTMFWVLRENLIYRDQILSDLREHLACEPNPIVDNGILCLVHESTGTTHLRTKWSEKLREDSLQDPSQALVFAQQAFSLVEFQGTLHDAKVLAALVVALEQNNKQQRANGMVEMATKSLGDGFISTFLEERAKLS